MCSVYAVPRNASTDMSNETEDKLEAEVYQLWVTAHRTRLAILADPLAYQGFARDLEEVSKWTAEALTAIKNTESLNVELTGM